ncbi:MAG: hypothetical protein RIB45_10395 [Marivibrio sp.]|uniref:hypothetical protein n=1 Tax=Marivibrio sp. TaxID=2039719 RepID=UPI0032EB2593
MTVDDFTLQGYASLLCALTQEGYSSVGYEDVRPTERQVIIRHDIDFEPTYALPLGELEKRNSVSGWYFFLVRSPFYNITAPQTVEVLHELRDMGHQIGLHFDASLFLDDPEVLDREARWECELLESVTSAPVEMVSFHRPKPALLGLAKPIGGRDHTYHPRYFNDIGYCSDSRGAWGHGHPLSHKALGEGRAFQLLTHPIWWATDSAGDPNAALATLQATRSKSLRANLAQTITGYDDGVGRVLKEGNR